MKNVLKIVFVIIGTTIGAGFASGQEIYLFFNKYGFMVIIGMILSCIITGFIIYKVFKILNIKFLVTVTLKFSRPIKYQEISKRLVKINKLCQA